MYFYTNPIITLIALGLGIGLFMGWLIIFINADLKARRCKPKPRPSNLRRHYMDLEQSGDAIDQHFRHTKERVMWRKANPDVPFNDTFYQHLWLLELGAEENCILNWPENADLLRTSLKEYREEEAASKQKTA